MLHYEAYNRKSRCTFFLDGAHTPRSMKLCAGWFGEVSAAANAKALLFYCSHDRDIVKIIEPLLKIGFKYVIFCPVDHSKPSSIKMPSMKDMLRRGGYASIAERVDVQAVCNKSDPLMWQLILRDIWTTVGCITDNSTEKIVVHSSINESIQFLQNVSENESECVSVLVTGSLYMVGGVLASLGFAP